MTEELELRFVDKPEFRLYQLVIVHLNGVQHVTEILQRCYDVDQAQWVYRVRGLDGLYPAEIIDFKKQGNRHE